MTDTARSVSRDSVNTGQSDRAIASGTGTRATLERTRRLGGLLSAVIRWGRVRLHDRLCRMARLQVDRSTMDILGTIKTRGALPRADLREIFGVNQSTISRQVSVAIASGLVEASLATRDGRTELLSLTPAGRKVQRLFADAYYAMVAEMITGWSEHDQAEVVRLLTKLTEQLQDEDDRV